MNDNQHEVRLTFAQWRELTFAPLVPFLLLAAPIVFVLGARGVIFSRGFLGLSVFAFLWLIVAIARRGYRYWRADLHVQNAQVDVTTFRTLFRAETGRTIKFSRILTRQIPSKSMLVRLYYLQDGKKFILVHVTDFVEEA